MNLCCGCRSRISWVTGVQKMLSLFSLQHHTLFPGKTVALPHHKTLKATEKLRRTLERAWHFGFCPDAASSKDALKGEFGDAVFSKPAILLVSVTASCSGLGGGQPRAFPEHSVLIVPGQNCPFTVNSSHYSPPFGLSASHLFPV